MLTTLAGLSIAISPERNLHLPGIWFTLARSLKWRSRYRIVRNAVVLFQGGKQ